VRDNLLAKLRAGEPAFPGILGFEDTVLPEVERALLAGHDLVCSASAARARPA
jgi:magnesium chelatase subunit I